MFDSSSPIDNSSSSLSILKDSANLSRREHFTDHNNDDVCDDVYYYCSSHCNLTYGDDIDYCNEFCYDMADPCYEVEEVEEEDEYASVTNFDKAPDGYTAYWLTDSPHNDLLCLDHTGDRRADIQKAASQCSSSGVCLGFNYDIDAKHSCLKSNLDVKKVSDEYHLYIKEE